VFLCMSMFMSVHVSVSVCVSTSVYVCVSVSIFLAMSVFTLSKRTSGVEHSMLD